MEAPNNNNVPISSLTMNKDGPPTWDFKETLRSIKKQKWKDVKSEIVPITGGDLVIEKNLGLFPGFYFIC